MTWHQLGSNVLYVVVAIPLAIVALTVAVVGLACIFTTRSRTESLLSVMDRLADVVRALQPDRGTWPHAAALPAARALPPGTSQRDPS